MAKKIIEEEKVEVTRETSEIETLRELHRQLTELGINRIGQLEVRIAELSK